MTRRSILLLFAVSQVALAQGAAPATPICWRARPLDRCQGWVITEAAVEIPTSSSSVNSSTVHDFDTRLAFTLGLMKNSDAKSAFGFGVALVNEDFGGRIEARWRRWLSPAAGVDVGLGMIGGHLRPGGRATMRGVTGSVGLSGTYLGADVRYDHGRTTTNQPVRATFVTIRAGSRASPIVTGVGLLAVLGLYLAWTGSGN
jgi:hypothetical protein